MNLNLEEVKAHAKSGLQTQPGVVLALVEALENQQVGVGIVSVLYGYTAKTLGDAIDPEHDVEVPEGAEVDYLTDLAEQYKPNSTCYPIIVHTEVMWYCVYVEVN